GRRRGRRGRRRGRRGFGHRRWGGGRGRAHQRRHGIAGSAVMAAETVATVVAAIEERLASGARCEAEGATVTVDVDRGARVDLLTFARDELGCDFFDWLTAVDEGDQGFAVIVHLYSIEQRHHLLLR